MKQAKEPPAPPRDAEYALCSTCGMGCEYVRQSAGGFWYHTSFSVPGPKHDAHVAGR